MQGRQHQAPGGALARASREPSATIGQDVSTSTRVVVLEEGLYALYFGEIATHAAVTRAASGHQPLDLPAILVSVPPTSAYDPVEILTGWHEVGEWLGAEGGTVVVKSPPGGGVVMWTIVGDVDGDCVIDIMPLGRGAASPAAALLTPRGRSRDALSSPAESEVPAEILLHIEREGDRRFSAGSWVGNRGKQLRVEAFSIRPLDAVAPNQIEYKAFGPNGRETPWVSDDRLCGTRGRGLPLTGFAVRLASTLRQQFDVVYEGSFFDSGVVGPKRNGEPCMPATGDDPLEAINVRIVRRDRR
jgi:hypothetical protein